MQEMGAVEVDDVLSECGRGGEAEGSKVMESLDEGVGVTGGRE